jgi:hypothetical protein
MTSPIFATQYLETLPAGITPADARLRLREAFGHLPISMVLLGWDLPPQFEDAIANETTRQGAQLYRWQPWLTSNTPNGLPPEMAAVGPGGTPIPGYNRDPAFNFICPNRAGVADYLEERLAGIARRGIFQGVFLDRIRFPSPADDPVTHLCCFCDNCSRLAAETGLDLKFVRLSLHTASSDKFSARRLVCSLLGKSDSPGSPLDTFIDFRSHSISRCISAAKRQTDALGLFLGLDCFSPSLARMEGQDLQILDSVCDWIKLMVYPRIFKPAGLPFELLGLATWLIRHGWTSPEAFNILSNATGFSFPDNINDFRSKGLESIAISDEIDCGRSLGITHLLAGIVLSEEGLIYQIKGDIMATRNADGLVISWDLWHTPMEHLDTILALWEL